MSFAVHKSMQFINNEQHNTYASNPWSQSVIQYDITLSHIESSYHLHKTYFMVGYKQMRDKLDC